MQAVSQTFQNYVPTTIQQFGKISLSPKGVFSRVSKVALPVIMLMALSNLPGADAGPIAYGICVSWCMALATPVMMPACIAACIPVGTAPTL